MNTIVYLIRHGEYEQSVDSQGRRLTPFPQTGLSETGRRQLTALARAIRKQGDTIDALYASPYQRTQDSAVLLQSQLGIPKLVIEQELRDVYTPGWWGVPVEELKAIGGDVYTIEPRTADQESYEQAARRIYGAFTSIAQGERGHPIGLVFHGDPIRVLLYQLEHPNETVPPMRQLSGSDYLDKGEAWRLVVETDGTLLQKEHIGRSVEEFERGERTY